MKRILLSGAVCFAASWQCLAQTPPPNDNFSNQIVLSGSSVTFSGTLAGATLETNEALGGSLGIYTYPTDAATKSIWWTWTAPQSSLVVLEMIGASADSILAHNTPEDGYAVYDTTNVFGSVQPMTNMTLDLSCLCPALTFPAIAGSNYQIQVIGSSSDTYQFLFLASNTPVILQQPRNLTVSTNASTLFTVVADGYQPLSYQWQFNGSNIPGQTVSMLALTNIDETMAGSYSAVVSNSGGITISSPGLLVVDSSNEPPSLSAIDGQAEQFDFQLMGEIGRNYRIESSVDLATWTNDKAFNQTPYEISTGSVLSPNLTSVVFNTNSSSTFLLSNNLPADFLRASQYAPVNEICINNLRQIRFAKLLWRRTYPEVHLRTDVPIGRDIAPYFPQGALPHCPDDTNAAFFTSYYTANCETAPLCDIFPSHILEEPQ